MHRSFVRLTLVVGLTVAVGCGSESTGPATESPDGLGSVVMLSAGAAHTCFLTSTHAVFCWGANNYGQLGDGSTTDRATPVAVHGGLSFTAIAASGGNTCALTGDGTAYCWGDNFYFQLGASSNTGPESCGGGTTNPCSRTPIPVSGGLRFTALSILSNHACSLTSSGAAYCWGVNSLGELGDGLTIESSTPIAVSGGLKFGALVSGGGSRGHTCGLIGSGAGFCWGYNASGQLGTGSNTGPELCNRGSPTDNPCSTTPIAISGGLSFSSLGVGVYYTCGLTTGGAAYCWGDNASGQLGDGLTGQSSTPVAVSGGLVFSALATGSSHACGFTSSGAASCWGDNRFGELGIGSATGPNLCNGYACSSAPVAVVGGLSYSKLALGGGHSCGLTSAGAVYCWGLNDHGQLGDGTTVQRLVPTRVAMP